jgi:hypothetical protein
MKNSSFATNSENLMRIDRFAYVSEWFGFQIKPIDLVSVFDLNRIESNRQKTKSLKFRFDSIFVDLKPTKIDAKRVHTKTLRCIANKYIYMHLAYAACAHAKKKIFFVEFIELIRSISNPFEFCKSDQNWAQLQALKLYDCWSYSLHIIFWCSWCSH